MNEKKVEAQIHGMGYGFPLNSVSYYVFILLFRALSRLPFIINIVFTSNSHYTRDSKERRLMAKRERIPSQTIDMNNLLLLPRYCLNWGALKRQQFVSFK